MSNLVLVMPLADVLIFQSLRRRWVTDPDRLPADFERHDTAFGFAKVPHRNARNGGELFPQSMRIARDLDPNAIESRFQGIVDRNAHAEMIGVVLLPVLEPFGIRPDTIAVRRGPLRRMQVEHWRLELLDHLIPHIEEPNAARPPRNLRLVADRKSHCSSTTSSGTCPAV